MRRDSPRLRRGRVYACEASAPDDNERRGEHVEGAARGSTRPKAAALDHLSLIEAAPAACELSGARRTPFGVEFGKGKNASGKRGSVLMETAIEELFLAPPTRVMHSETVFVVF